MGYFSPTFFIKEKSNPIYFITDMIQIATIQKGKNVSLTDADYIRGLKAGDAEITHKFFYELCHYTLNDIRVSLMHKRQEYDDLVNELYLYLSPNQWHKLDTFSGLNGCHLQSWMVPLSWRFFMQRRSYLLGFATDENEDITTMKSEAADDFDIEVAMDVEQTFGAMPNKNYVNILKMLLVEGYTAEEVAVKLGTNADNVYNIKHRAIVQFIRIYGGERKKKNQR